MAVVALEIQRREPVLRGATFGTAGAYEKLAGVVRLAVDPALPVHRAIAALERAPRNMREAAWAMVGERHVLEEDGAAVVERAGRLWKFIHSADGPLP